MAQYIIGKRMNKRKLTYTEQKNLIGIDDFVETKTLIVRGIGYRAFALKNELLSQINLSAKFVESSRPLYSVENGSSIEKELSEIAS
jgi:hypothetical protein